MNYELAKQLKEAGFRQNGYGQFVSTTEQMFNELIEPGGVYMMPADNVLYLPTLSDLIDAVGNGFTLERIDRFEEETVWRAKTTFGTGKGSTPEEAVAKLWLELNK